MSILQITHQSKECSKCKELKLFCSFPILLRSKTGFASSCKECKRIHYNKNKDAILAKQKEYNKANAEKIRYRSRVYNATHSDEIAINNRRYYLENIEKIRVNAKIYAVNNKDKISESRSIYYEKNKDIINEKNKANAIKNKELMQQYKKIYYQRNKEKIAEYNRNYRDKYRDYLINVSREYYQSHKEQHRDNARKYNKTLIGSTVRKNSHHKRRTIKKQGNIKTQDIINLQQNAKVCYWCNESLKDKKVHIDHYVPLSKGGEHILSNIVISCDKCNLSKSAKDPIVFANSIGKLF